MPFLMGGFPSQAASLEIGHAYVDGGAHLVELGVPCANPIADGPVICAAGGAARRAGASVEGVLHVAEVLAARVPVVLMCYAEVVLARGAQRFAGELHDAGMSGLIVPDLPARELAAMLDACDRAGVALVPLVAPTTTDDGVARIGARVRGFVYTVSVSGTTGERSTLADGASSLIGRVKRHTAAPVALGFGISTPRHAVQAADAGADGIIVGSRLVRAAAEARDAPAAVHDLVAELSRALAGEPLAAAPRPRPERPVRAAQPGWRPFGTLAGAA